MSVSTEEATTAPLGATKLALIMTGLCLAVLLTGMDQTILATAAPTISEEFHALDDIAWWTNIYLLTLSAFQLFYGKLYTFFPIKLIYIGAIILFEIGSLVCTTAPNSTALIFGRAIAGFGAAGIFSGGVLITTKIIPLSQRPAYLGIMSAVFGVGAIIGPFIGGALTDRSTWRWCFGINLPVGALTILVCIILVHTPLNANARPQTVKDKIRDFDIPGTMLMVTGLVCLLLALQWGGGMYAWNDGRVISLFALSGILLSLFTFLQTSNRISRARTIPASISTNRDIWFASSYAAALTGGIYVVMLYLPFWFQIVLKGNAMRSGVLLTPTIGAYVIGSVLAGGITSGIGYYNPPMILGSVLLIPGAVVLTTLKPNTPVQKIIGYELLYGFGAGFGFGQPSYVVQTLLPEHDVPIGVTLITLVQNLSASVFVAVGQSVFQNGLRRRLTTITHGSGAGSTASFLNTGANNLLDSMTSNERVKALEAFSEALVTTMYIPLAMACATVVGAAGTKWQSMKTPKAIDSATNGEEIMEKTVGSNKEQDNIGQVPFTAVT